MNLKRSAPLIAGDMLGFGDPVPGHAEGGNPDVSSWEGGRLSPLAYCSFELAEDELQDLLADRIVRNGDPFAVGLGPEDSRLRGVE